MLFIKAYHFFIVDCEFEESYHYYGYFLSTVEVLKFMRENRKAGNLIRALDCDLYSDNELPE